MKILKRILAVSILSAALCLAGCGEKPDKTIDTESYTITVGDEWKEMPMEGVEDATSLVKNKNESITIVKAPMEPGVEDLTIEEYKELVKQGFEMQPGIEVSVLEIQEKEMGEVIYFESKINMSEIGDYKEGIVVDQIGVYYRNENEVITFAAQVANGAKTDEAKAELESILKTIVIK